MSLCIYQKSIYAEASRSERSNHWKQLKDLTKHVMGISIEEPTYGKFLVSIL